MNYTMIAGHLGADPEVRFTSSGKKVTTLRVAARCRRGGKDKTIWWRVSVWGEEFDKMMAYLKKGSPIFVIGEMNEPEIFTNRDGKPQISMSLTAVDLSFSPFGRPDGGNSENPSHAANEPSHGPSLEPAAAFGPPTFGQGKVAPSFSDDEVPF